MAYVHKIAANAVDSHQTNPYWLAVVVRFKVRDSFNHSFSNPGSKPEVEANPVAEDGDPLVIDSDIVAWNTSSSKLSHVSSASMTLVDAGTDYTLEVAPDDWILFWAFDNRHDFERVRTAIQNKNEPVNKFDDGLKFVGRVDAVRKIQSRDPRSGGLHRSFAITAQGFVEFDSLIYYNEMVAKKYPSSLQFMPDFGVALNDFVLAGRTHPQTAIPSLLGICLGSGPGDATKGFAIEAVAGQEVDAELQQAAQSPSLIASPNRAYRIPDSVARLLGRITPLRDVGWTYSDILQQVIGIQRYDGTDFVSRFNQPLDGDSLPYPVNFNKVTVWSILGTFLNTPINEMYTCLRVDASGDVLPTFVCRQLPLSSREFIDSGGIGTAFLDLPRWSIDTNMIISIDTGRSNATRFNYVYLHGQDNLGSSGVFNTALGHARNPPITDPGDVMRAGLRMFDQQVSGTIIETQYTNSNSPGRRWSHLMADALFGGHLKYTGTVVLQGIQAPICEGDNVVVDDVIYHIERVQHAGQIDASGARVFTTTLFLINGIHVISDEKGTQVYPDLRTTSQLGLDLSNPTDTGTFGGLDQLVEQGNEVYAPITVDKE
jgi:hypothetical protein